MYAYKLRVFNSREGIKYKTRYQSGFWACAP
jgi:hypothetical protein